MAAMVQPPRGSRGARACPSLVRARPRRRRHFWLCDEEFELAVGVPHRFRNPSPDLLRFHWVYSGPRRRPYDLRQWGDRGPPGPGSQHRGL